MTNVLIIEDEAKAARELANMLRQIDEDIAVLAILDSVEESVKWLSSHNPPDLVFSDIQLADGLCFEIFNQLELRSPVIFCTAFDEYLMNAFETNAVSYLLKPIGREKVEKALEKFWAMKSIFKQEDDKGLTGLLQQLELPYKKALLVHQKEKIIPLPVNEIAFFYLGKSSINIVTLSNSKYQLTSSLEEIEKSLDPEMFYRANRQFLINRNAIANAERFFARKLVAKLMVDTPETVIISKAKASEFLKWLEA